MNNKNKIKVETYRDHNAVVKYLDVKKKNTIGEILNKIVKWGCFTVLCSFFPLIASIIVSSNFGYQNNTPQYASELLFACITISCDSLRILSNTKNHNYGALKDIFFIISFITILFPAILYGILLLNNNLIANNRDIIILLTTSIICGFILKLLYEEV